MKIEMVDKEKIKVTLSFQDLMCFNIEPEKIEPNSHGLHRFLFHIMENVRKETGFNPYSGQVVVEAINSPSGITLYISRLKNKLTKSQKEDLKKSVKCAKPVLKNKKMNENRYLFLKLDDFCNAILLMDNKCFLNSSLYKYNNGWYFIYKDDKDFMKSHSVLSEYCESYGNMIYSKSFLEEHGELIAKNQKMISMAKGIKNLMNER